MVREIKGDFFKQILTGIYDHAVHGCNCQKNMGAGLAKMFANQYPQLRVADQEHQKPTMGGYSNAYDSITDTNLVNIYSQFWYGKPYGNVKALRSQKYAFDIYENRLNAMKKAFTSLNAKYSGDHFLIPMIGAGLAGGDWNDIKTIIKNSLKDCHITFVYKKN